MSGMMTEDTNRVYNGLEVISMNAAKKAIEIVETLSPEKLEIAVGMLELLEKNNDLDNVKELIELIKFEASCETVEVTAEEREGIIQGEAEIKAGLGVKAEDVWKELGV